MEALEAVEKRVKDGRKIGSNGSGRKKGQKCFLELPQPKGWQLKIADTVWPIPTLQKNRSKSSHDFSFTCG